MEMLMQIGWASAVVAVAFTLFDYLTGYIGAAKTKTVLSGKMREGLYHKAGFWLILLLSAATEIALFVIKADLAAAGMDDAASVIPYIPSLPAVSAIVVWIEVNSIAENLCVLAPELKSLSFMQKLKEHNPASADVTVAIEEPQIAADEDGFLRVGGSE